MSFRGNLIKKFYIYMTFPPFKFSLLFFHFITHIKANKKNYIFNFLTYISMQKNSPLHTSAAYKKYIFLLCYKHQYTDETIIYEKPIICKNLIIKQDKKEKMYFLKVSTVFACTYDCTTKLRSIKMQSLPI